ncbi:hypothetical protein P3603_22760 [Vibrio parahaemolyticus]|nr:hypothetical protein [Vibrio parahaemolyticus]
MKVTKELTQSFFARLEEARVKFGDMPFGDLPGDVLDILIAGELLDQATNQIERLNPHKESFIGDLSPVLENMIKDAGLEVDDVKHIILAAQAETNASMMQSMVENVNQQPQELFQRLRQNF